MRCNFILTVIYNNNIPIFITKNNDNDNNNNNNSNNNNNYNNNNNNNNNNINNNINNNNNNNPMQQLSKYWQTEDEDSPYYVIGEVMRSLDSDPLSDDVSTLTARTV